MQTYLMGKRKGNSTGLANSILQELLSKEIVDNSKLRPLQISTISPEECAILNTDLQINRMQNMSNKLRTLPEFTPGFTAWALAIRRVASRYDRAGNRPFKYLIQQACQSVTSDNILSRMQPPAPSISAADLGKELENAFRYISPTKECESLRLQTETKEDLSLYEINTSETGHNKTPEIALATANFDSQWDRPFGRVSREWRKHATPGRLLVRLPKRTAIQTYGEGIGILSTWKS